MGGSCTVTLKNFVVNFGFNTFTPWKTNMEPENDGLEDDFPIQLGDL